MSQFQFEYRGGRLKLLEPDDLRVAAPVDGAVTQSRSLRSRQKAKKAKAAERKAVAAEEEFRMIQAFLASHNFKDVNQPKYGLFGFRWSYPLHQAVKEKLFRIAEALVKSGANLWAKDSSGKTALDFAEQDVQCRLLILHHDLRRTLKPSKPLKPFGPAQQSTP